MKLNLLLFETAGSSVQRPVNITTSLKSSLYSSKSSVENTSVFLRSISSAIFPIDLSISLSASDHICMEN